MDTETLEFIRDAYTYTQTEEMRIHFREIEPPPLGFEEAKDIHPAFDDDKTPDYKAWVFWLSYRPDIKGDLYDKCREIIRRNHFVYDQPMRVSMTAMVVRQFDVELDQLQGRLLATTDLDERLQILGLDHTKRKRETIRFAYYD